MVIVVVVRVVADRLYAEELLVECSVDGWWKGKGRKEKGRRKLWVGG